jgi:hypothetical protein
MKEKLFYTLIAAGTLLQPLSAQQVEWNSPGAGNPILPGYFADPTVKKIGDTYYIYATTDGNGGGLGPSQVWTSKDFVNWTIMPMNWPRTHWIWAPDVMEKDGKFYLYYCQPCQIYCGVGETPRGPWTNILGEEEAVLVPDRYVTNAITLDGQTFTDDKDGKTYLYFGTWGIYPGFGCGVAELSPDLKGFVRKRLIVNTEATDFFEAPFVVKKNGIYYFMYSSGSCHDDTYRVQYATSTEGPMGPYVFGKNNPILATNADKTIDGPGHHSVLQEGDNYYIVYHRHNLPGSTRGMHRQIAVDRLVFGPDGTIEKVNAGHNGIGCLQPNTNPFANLAFCKEVTASSYYNDNFKPAYAVDDNNATLWRPRTTGTEWLQVDLGKVEQIERIWTQFEYATSYYQYYIETSVDGKQWSMFSDRRENLQSGSPMVDYGSAQARYVRLTVTGNEKNGLSGAVWNFKVFSAYKEDPPQQLICLPASSYENGMWKNNMGMLARGFRLTSGTAKSAYTMAQTPGATGQEVIFLEPNTQLVMENMPAHFYEKRPYTLSYKVYCYPEESLNTLFTWHPSQKKYTTKSKKQGNKQLYSVAIVADGSKIFYYVDGELKRTERQVRYDRATSPGLTLQSGEGKVAVTDIRLYNWKQEPAEIKYDATTPIVPVTPASKERKGLIVEFTADDYLVGSSISSIPNKAPMGGNFQSRTSSLPVELKANRKAFTFNGSQQFRSDFGLPTTMTGNSPYTIEAWVLNPEADDTECIVDLVAAQGELEKISFGNGTNPDRGLIGHNGSFEDMGLPEAAEPTGQWKHIAVTFDGYMERIYIDGQEVKAKDIVLRLPEESEFITLGQQLTGESPFTGYLHALKIYDIARSAEEIAADAAEKSTSPIAFLYAAQDITDSLFTNEGSWGGSTRAMSMPQAYAGKIALTQPVTINSTAATKAPMKALALQFAAQGKIKKEATLLAWEGFSLKLTKKGLAYQAPNWNSAWESDKESGKKTTWAPGEWHQIVLTAQNEKWALFVDGQLVMTFPYAALSVPTQLTLGDAGSKKPAVATASAQIFTDPLSEVELNDLQTNATKNELAGKVFSVGALPLSPELVRLTVYEGGKPATPGTLKFSFSTVGDGNSYSWELSPNRLMNLPAGTTRAKYTFAVKDAYGNVYQGQEPVETDASPSVFNGFTCGFDATADYLSNPTSDGWDGLLANTDPHYAMEATAADGQLTLTSQNCFFNPDGKDNGPVLYKTVEGDFLMQVKVSDFTGRANRRPVGYDEGGLMVLDLKEDSTQNALHIGVFPHYNVGNILTNIRNGHRMQQQNNAAWDYRPYLQIERKGDTFYVRCSTDGKNWEEMIGSPVQRRDLAGRKLKVGLYQVTYGLNKASFSFDDFQLWQRR